MRTLGLALLGFSLAAVDLPAGWRSPVPTEAGLVAGTLLADGNIRVFRGIPYAAPPVGALRWLEPKPAPRWAGVRPADRFGPIEVQTLPAPGSFYQLEYYTGPAEPMSEDCLYLNIWSPASNPHERLPVMVWIYGGAGIRGAGSESCFDGQALARHGVVVVTFNYRLNVFGWFAHPELSRESSHRVSGNYAELDQIAALAWVRRNIGAFGGNPDAVTVFGQSSGGSCINRLLISPPAGGLFQRAILESAGALADRDPRATLAEMERRGSAFAAQLGVHSLAELRLVPAERLLAASARAGFGPNIDGWILPELPAKIYDRGGQTPVPLLIGSNADESPLSPLSVAAFRREAVGDFGAQAAAYFELYPAASDVEASRARHDSLRDKTFAGARAKAAMQTRLGAPAYLYYFDRAPPGRDRDRHGAFHGAETEYVFGTLDTTPRPWTETDRRLSELMSAYWAQFAATGNPNGGGRPPWPAYNEQTDEEMELGDRVGAQPVPNRERLAFYERLLGR